jgi:hypothetical protein
MNNLQKGKAIKLMEMFSGKKPKIRPGEVRR